MKNPLLKRIPREFKSELGKQLAIFLFFVLIIGAGSGFFVADNSLLTAYDESFEKYSIEDGNLELAQPADSALIAELEKDSGIRLYENFYKQEETEDFESKLRIFGERKEIDLVCLMEGELPAAENEIAVDRLYARNHELKQGSVIKLSDTELTVSGIVALSDYSALFESPSDLMFDNDKFGVGVMSSAGFEALRDNHLHFIYSWKYNEKPEDDKQAKEMADELIKKIAPKAQLTGFIPEYSNQAIIFTGNDMGGDESGMTVFLYITIVILAFIFAITTDSTITSEAGVIGTLRASGYTRGEILRHYLMIPMMTLLIASVIGNIIGYTLLEKFFAYSYYNSYSLPTYNVLFNADALIKTTVIPLAIMLVINVITLMMKLKLSPLRFIRRDLSRRRNKKAFRLNTKIPIMVRFRLRIIFQNLPNYITLIIGSLLANAILLFGMVFGPMLDNYQDTVKENMLAPQISVLKAPAESSDPSAENGLMTTAASRVEGYAEEDITVYGITEGSRYVHLDAGSGMIASSAYRDKYGLSEGDTVTLYQRYGSGKYELKIDGFYEYPAAVALFCGQEKLRETFPEDEIISIVFSESRLTDIDDKLIAATVSEADLTKTSRQLIRSMNGLMKIFLIFGIIMFVLVIFLLAKIIIERNAQSISMTKILGYTNREINGLYIHSTTIVAVASIVLTIPLANFVIGKLIAVVFRSYPGYFEYSVSPFTLIEAGLIGVGAYALTALLLVSKVKKIHLAEALKNVE